MCRYVCWLALQLFAGFMSDCGASSWRFGQARGPPLHTLYPNGDMFMHVILITTFIYHRGESLICRITNQNKQHARRAYRKVHCLYNHYVIYLVHYYRLSPSNNQFVEPNATQYRIHQKTSTQNR
jgi:hypothetical protein